MGPFSLALSSHLVLLGYELAVNYWRLIGGSPGGDDAFSMRLNEHSDPSIQVDLWHLVLHSEKFPPLPLRTQFSQVKISVSPTIELYDSGPPEGSATVFWIEIRIARHARNNSSAVALLRATESKLESFLAGAVCVELNALLLSNGSSNHFPWHTQIFNSDNGWSDAELSSVLHRCTGAAELAFIMSFPIGHTGRKFANFLRSPVWPFLCQMANTVLSDILSDLPRLQALVILADVFVDGEYIAQHLPVSNPRLAVVNMNWELERGSKHFWNYSEAFLRVVLLLGVEHTPLMSGLKGIILFLQGIESDLCHPSNVEKARVTLFFSTLDVYHRNCYPICARTHILVYGTPHPALTTLIHDLGLVDGMEDQTFRDKPQLLNALSHLAITQRLRSLHWSLAAGVDDLGRILGAPERFPHLRELDASCDGTNKNFNFLLVPGLKVLQLKLDLTFLVENSYMDWPPRTDKACYKLAKSLQMLPSNSPIMLHTLQLKLKIPFCDKGFPHDSYPDLVAAINGLHLSVLATLDLSVELIPDDWFEKKP
ncbi:hypothetical protein DFH08DRAFT_985661 [Mycena albidolilacea]|uniref:Uncharacterized protein n=1 Tax=Mycena albidolilacea TaxID=1033008 RepID=A0AAD7E9B4_9AGAR|nr:hypothetical protein DFH08DRAFT_985661 [Mycena albidolilacea]